MLAVSDTDACGYHSITSIFLSCYWFLRVSINVVSSVCMSQAEDNNLALGCQLLQLLKNAPLQLEIDVKFLYCSFTHMMLKYMKIAHKYKTLNKTESKFCKQIKKFQHPITFSICNYI